MHFDLTISNVHTTQMSRASEAVAAALAPLGDLSLALQEVAPAGGAATAAETSTGGQGDDSATRRDAGSRVDGLAYDEGHLHTVEECEPIIVKQDKTWMTAEAIMDFLATREGEWVPWPEIAAATDRHYTSLGAVTTWSRATHGLDTPWRRREDRDGSMEFSLSTEAAHNWRQAKERYGHA